MPEATPAQAPLQKTPTAKRPGGENDRWHVARMIRDARKKMAGEISDYERLSTNEELSKVAAHPYKFDYEQKGEVYDPGQTFPRRFATRMSATTPGIGEPLEKGALHFEVRRNQDPQKMARQAVLEFRRDKIQDLTGVLTLDTLGRASKISPKTEGRVQKLIDKLRAKEAALEKKMPIKHRSTDRTRIKRYEE